MTDRDYFTADTHFNHGMILKYCGRTGFMTPEDLESYKTMRIVDHQQGYLDWKPSVESRLQMDEQLIENINAVVPADATLWHLGDFAFCRRVAEVKRYRDAIKCKDIRLIWGNHDKRKTYPPGLFQAYYESMMIYVFNDRTLTEAEIHADRQLRKKLRRALSKKTVQPIALSHYAQVVWAGSHKGWFQLYGHSHGGLRKWMRRHMPNALSMDVGVDCNNFAPLSYSQILDVLRRKRETKPKHAVDHHGPWTFPPKRVVEGDLTK